MTTKKTSPFGSSFTSAIKRGTPCCVAVNNIATRTGKTPAVIFQSLYNAGYCWRQKVGGQWIYWPCTAPKKSSATHIKNCQGHMWQWFVDWCIASGSCTPKNLHNHCGSQQEFMTFCRKFWNHQFNGVSTSKTSKPKLKTRKPSVKSGRKSYAPKSFRFPTMKSRTVTTKRYRKAA